MTLLHLSHVIVFPCVLLFISCHNLVQFKIGSEQVMCELLVGLYLENIVCDKRDNKVNCQVCESS